MGRSSLAPNWSYLARLCLFLKLGLPAEGLGFAQGPDLHWTPQHTVRVEQSWLSGNWGWGWDGTLRPGSVPGQSPWVGTAPPPFLLPQPLLGKGRPDQDAVSQAYLPSFSSLFRVGGSSDDHVAHQGRT